MSETITIASLNQYTFCPRRCFLMYVEKVYTDNRFTLEGTDAHEHTDLPGCENRLGVRVERALPLFSKRLGLSGKADVVEFHTLAGKKEQPYPVDYKRGPRKKWANDDVQLCAQALCLEEMLECNVPEGAIFHIKSKRRREVNFDDELRRLTVETINKVHDLFISGRMPPAFLRPRCHGCSLESFCLPELSQKQKKASTMVNDLFRVEIQE